jgi:predicted HTH transcriptional regulator
MSEFSLNSLDDINLLRESSEIECKLAGGKDGKGAVPNDMWESYSAFANTDGGYIILGLKEKQHRFSVVGIENIEKVKAEVFNLANNTNKVSVNLLNNSNVTEVEINGKKLLVIYVSRAKRQERPVYLNGNPMGNTFKRGNESDQTISGEQVKRMLAEQIEDSRDDEVLVHFSMADLDLETLRVYRQTYANLNPNHPWNELDNASFLRMIAAWRINRETGQQGPTVAGLLMFGLHTSIQEKFPYYMLDYQERPEAKKELRWVDRLTLDGSWSGNLYDFSRKVYRKLIDDLKIPFKLREGTRQEDTPVHIALREALANVIVHADYSGRSSVLVVKRPDMFGFRNPGLMRVPIDIALHGGEPDCRNRLLAQMFRYIKFGEQAGSGIRHILDGWKSQHWKMPLLREVLEPNEQTLLELRMIDLYPEEVIQLLNEKFADKFTQLSELERTIVITVYSDLYLTHHQLCTQTAAHTREVTLALVKLSKMGIIDSSGEQRSKVYHRPNIEVPTPDNVAGQFLAEHEFVVNPEKPTENPELLSEDPELPSESPELSPESPELHKENPELSDTLWHELMRVGQAIRNQHRPKKEDMETVIIQLLSIASSQYIRLSQFAELLGKNTDALRKNHLNRLLKEDKIGLAFPTSPNHPAQGYKLKEDE